MGSNNYWGKAICYQPGGGGLKSQHALVKKQLGLSCGVKKKKKSFRINYAV